MSDPEPLIGEPLALDLLNTRPSIEGRPVDFIASPEGLRFWLGLQAARIEGFSVADAAGLDAADHAKILALRDQVGVLVAAVRQGQAPDAGALDGLNAALHAAPEMRSLELGGKGGLTVERTRAGSAGARLAALLAAAAADLLADPACAKVRQCAAEDCTMLFLPAHPRRQWCSAARCGNRARVARYYRRHKAD